jgi:enterochelin esterase-like enzyme
MRRTLGLLLGASCFALLLLARSARADAPKLDPAPAGFDKPREGIAHGTIEPVEYDSKSTGGKRRMVVYTPPGFSKDVKYPVFYLLHGAGDDETGWQKKGSAAVILDNLYADKKIVPMIVVMPNGRARTPDAAQPSAGAPFENDLLKDVIPYIESHYPVLADRDHRAIAGLSMGGGQSLGIGLKHLDTFAWVGGFSSAARRTSVNSLVSDPEKAAKQLRLLWLSCGDKDSLMGANEAVHTALEGQKIAHIWHIDSGGHTWPVWKNDLYLLGQRLFRDKAQ